MRLGRAYKYLTGQRMGFLLPVLLLELAGRHPPPDCVLACQTATFR